MRRLIYQSLIWTEFVRHQPRGLGSPFNPKRLKRQPDALVDCVGRNAELDRDFLGGKMLVNQAETIKLTRGES